jgi:hypothetical protein
MIEKETQVRFIGYGAMLMESFVAVMAIIAASIIDPGLYYAMNAPAAVVGDTVQSASQAVNGLGFAITPGALPAAARAVDEQTLIARTGGAPTLADRHVADLLRRTGNGPAGLLVPLRDHVRGPVHPHHGGRGHAGRALHAAGHARQRLQAVRRVSWKPGCGSRARSSSARGATSSTPA